MLVIPMVLRVVLSMQLARTAGGSFSVAVGHISESSPKLRSQFDFNVSSTMMVVVVGMPISVMASLRYIPSSRNIFPAQKSLAILR